MVLVARTANQTKPIHRNLTETDSALCSTAWSLLLAENAYLSNLVKCGMNNKKGDFKELEEYDSECVKTCVENILTKEIDAINPVVVFCFGNKVQHNLLEFVRRQILRFNGSPSSAFRS